LAQSATSKTWQAEESRLFFQAAALGCRLVFLLYYQEIFLAAIDRQQIRIGPFSTAGYIRRCVAMTNGLKPDLIVLTGDYIAWDPSQEREVVRELAGPP
jgi:hypothetical protein